MEAELGIVSEPNLRLLCTETEYDTAYVSPTFRRGSFEVFLTDTLTTWPDCEKEKPATPVTLVPLYVALTRVALPRPLTRLSTMFAN
jgi:hypothetical protein